MAHFAIVENGVVVAVLKVDDADITRPDGTESEQLGQQFLASLYSQPPSAFVQTSYTNQPIEGRTRGKYAGIGDIWDGAEFTDPTP